MSKVGFDNQRYVETQSARIRERIAQFGGKLYLEFGGKLFDDYHAARVLPGFAPDSKIRMLLELRDSAEIVVAINAADIEQNKVRGDLGITYDEDVLRLIDTFRGEGLYVGSVVITRYAAQPSADAFKRRLEDLGVTVYLHYPIPGYPHDVGHIMSDQGFGRNDYIETTRPPGGGHRPRPRLREDGDLPVPALPPPQPGRDGRICQIRDLPHLEPAPQAPGEPGL